MMQAEELHDSGELFAKKVVDIFHNLGLGIQFRKKTYECTMQTEHETEGQHTLDILFLSFSGTSIDKTCLAECTESIREYDELESLARKIPEKAHCLQITVPFMKQLPRIADGLVVVEREIGPRIMNRFTGLQRDILVDSHMLVQCIHGSRFRLLAGMAEFISNARNQIRWKLFELDLASTRTPRQANTMCLEWLLSNDVIYLLLLKENDINVGIFDMGGSYSLARWTQDLQSAVSLGLTVKRVESVSAFPDDLIAMARDGNLEIPFVDHRHRASYFCPMWDYTVLR